MNTPAHSTSDSGSPPIKWPLLTAAALVLVEGVTLAAYVIWVGISAISQPPDRLGLALATLGLLLAVGIALGYAGVRLARGHGRVRALAILGQLIIGAIGYDYLSRGVSAGAIGFVIAAVIIVLLVVPSSTVVLADPDRRTDSADSDESGSAETT